MALTSDAVRMLEAVPDTIKAFKTDTADKAISVSNLFPSLTFVIEPHPLL